MVEVVVVVVATGMIVLVPDSERSASLEEDWQFYGSNWMIKCSLRVFYVESLAALEYH